MELIRKYPLDVSGKNPTNLVTGEPHSLVETPDNQHRVIVPNYGGFFTSTLKVYDENLTELIPYTDYVATYLFEDATELTGLEVCGAIIIKNPNVSKKTFIDYQVVGGNYAMSTDALAQVLAVLDNSNRPVEWAGIVGKPTEYPPGGHLHALWELYGFEYMVVQLDRIVHAILLGDQAAMDELRDYAYSLYEDGKRYTDALDDRFKLHASDTRNPHSVTKAQVGLGDVENFPVATLLEIEAGTATNRYVTVDGLVHGIDHHLGKDFRTHLADKANPHDVTKTQVGLGNVDNYATATQSIAEAGTANNRFMTPLRVAQAITAQIGNRFDDHAADTSNPHKVTKVQVGLGSVQNYGIATETEAQLGERNDRYMTALRVAQAIDTQAGIPFRAHVGDYGNPHRVTKAQVGLGSVENLSLASKSEAESGTSHVRYMTPLRVKEAIASQALTVISAHERRVDNPHSVTKAQVGLGSVQNYGLASTAQATAGTLNTVYMTPVRVKEAIAAQVGDDFAVHSGRTDNPHNVTKAQVGLGSVLNYGIASKSEAEAGTVNNLYMTPLRVKEAITSQAGTLLAAHTSDFNNPHKVTKSQVGLSNVDNYSTASQAEAETGTANNRFMTPLRTAQAITSQVGNQLNTHAGRTDNPHNVTKAQVGLGNVENYVIATKAQAEAGTLDTRYMTPLRVKEAITFQAGSLLDSHTKNTSNPHKVTKSQVGLSNVDNYSTASVAEATAGTRSDRFVTPEGVKAAIDSGVGSDLSSHTSNRNNPHNVTKSQVGLGSVENLSLASKGEAEAGTLNTRYMTPLRVAQAITAQAGSLLSSHTSNRNNPHSVTKAQVGLNLVENYRLATKPEAEAGTSHVFYMTPLRTREAIDTRVPVLMKSHVDARNNPHGVTKAQVGLGSVQNYGISSANEARQATVTDKYLVPANIRQGFPTWFNEHVTNGFTMPRTGRTSRINFGEWLTDAGYIEHIVDSYGGNNNEQGSACFRFTVSDDAVDNGGFDRFEFGGTKSGQSSNPYVYWMRLERHIAQFRSDVRAYGNVITNDVQFLSDRRLKENITPLTGALTKLNALNGVDYTWKNNGKRTTGLVAQEVQTVLPHAVTSFIDEDDGEEYLKISSSGPVALLVEAVKELHQQTRTQAEHIQALEVRLSALGG